MGGLELDAGTRGPVVDAALRTSRPGVFAAGNLLHGAEQADVAALGGRHAGASVARHLKDGSWPERRVPVLCRAPLAWVSPNALSPAAGPPPRARFLVRSHEFLTHPRVEIAQDGARSGAGAWPGSRPAAPRAAAGRWTARADPDGGPVTASSALGARVTARHGARRAGARSGARRREMEQHWTSSASASTRRAASGKPRSRIPPSPVPSRSGRGGVRPGRGGRRRDPERGGRPRDGDHRRVRPAARGGPERSGTGRRRRPRPRKPRRTRASPVRRAPRPGIRTRPVPRVARLPRLVGVTDALKGPIKAGLAALFAVGVLLLLLDPPTLSGAEGLAVFIGGGLLCSS